MCAALFAFQALGVAGPRRSATSLFGEYVAEAQRVCQFQERCIVPRAGPHSLVPPAPHGFGMGVEAAVQLCPRQGRLLLEAHEALWEVVGEVICPSAVVSSPLLSESLVTCKQQTRLDVLAPVP